MSWKDVVGNIKPSKVYNLWRFRKDPATYKLIDTLDIWIDRPKIEPLVKGKNAKWHILYWIQEVGECVEKKLDGLAYMTGDTKIDAWVINHISEMDKNTLTVSIDVFKKDNIFDKIRYFILKTCVKSKE